MSSARPARALLTSRLYKGWDTLGTGRTPKCSPTDPRIADTEDRKIITRGKEHRAHVPVSKENRTSMSRLFQFLGESLSRGRRKGPRPDVMHMWPADDRDPLHSYLRVLEEARDRRGGLSSRF
jgi:hypothetical protein